MRGQGSGHPSTDDDSPLLPEEEQLYREFELYLRAISDEAARAMIQRIDEFAKRLREGLIPLESLPKETQSKLDSALRNLAEMSHQSAVQLRHTMDDSLRRLAEMSHSSATQMQQAMDSSLRRLESISVRIEKRVQSSLDRFDTLADRTETCIHKRLQPLHNLLVGGVVLAVVNLILLAAILFKMWR